MSFDFDDTDADLRAEFSTTCPLRRCDGSGTIRERHGFSFGPSDDSDCECREIADAPDKDIKRIMISDPANDTALEAA